MGQGLLEHTGQFFERFKRTFAVDVISDYLRLLQSYLYLLTLSITR